MSAEFIITLATPDQLQSLLRGNYLHGKREPRIAMVGRSNVGKSSLINSMMSTRLAKVSKEPGKTRHIHFYAWPEEGKIVADLPGFGYAKVNSAEQERWGQLIQAYFEADLHLERCLVLLDARHGPTPADEDAIRFLGGRGIPITFVFTKSDTLKSQSERVQRRREATQALQKLIEGLPADRNGNPARPADEAIWVSAETKDGLKPLIMKIRAVNANNDRAERV